MERNMVQTASLWLIALAMITAPASAEVWTYDVLGGKKYSSPDYEVTVESDGKTHRSFVHYSYGRDQYNICDWKGEP